jgi:PIN domain nuclease of toxin-antitoxin system
MIASPRATVWISVATLWEIAIKHDLGRGDMPIASGEALRYFRESGYRFLAVEPEHAVAIEDLPAHHADPFDRILIAQALVEPMRLITHDAMIARYSDTIIAI